MSNETIAEPTPQVVPTGVLSALSVVPPSTLMTEDALAGALQINKRTIRRMVQRGELPPGVPFAGHKTWMAGRVLQHFEQRADKAAREAEKHQQKLHLTS